MDLPKLAFLVIVMIFVLVSVLIVCCNLLFEVWFVTEFSARLMELFL